MNAESGLPKDYHELQMHAKLRERDVILTSAGELRAWTADPY